MSNSFAAFLVYLLLAWIIPTILVYRLIYPTYNSTLSPHTIQRKKENKNTRIPDHHGGHRHDKQPGARPGTPGAAEKNKPRRNSLVEDTSIPRHGQRRSSESTVLCQRLDRCVGLSCCPSHCLHVLCQVCPLPLFWRPSLGASKHHAAHVEILTI